MAKRKDSEKEKRKVGRSPGYSEMVAPKFEEIKAAYAAGAIDKDVIKMLGIATSTFYRYQDEEKEFKDHIKACKEVRWDGIEDSLFRRARGFSVSSPVRKEKWIRNKDSGEMELVEATEEIKETYFPPDTTAGIFTMTNRRNDRWKRNTDQVEGEVQSDGVTSIKFVFGVKN